MTANKLTAELLTKLPDIFPCRVWRQNTGKAYGLSTIKKVLSLIRSGEHLQAKMLLSTARPITYSHLGAADITGIITVDGVGVRLEIEVKSKGDRMSEEQYSYRNCIDRFGGIYIIASSIEQCIDDIYCEINRIFNMK